MARQVVVVGMAKTGTVHISQMFKKLFAANGIDGIAQHQKGFGNISPNIDFIDADWSKSPKIKAISEKYPYVRFIILYRRVLECCYSLRNFYTDKRNPHKDFTPEQLVDQYWKRTYKSIAEQLPFINPKPWFLWSKDYFDGHINQVLLDMFELPVTETNMKIVNDYLKVPANRSRSRVPMTLSDDIQNECQQIGEDIEKECKPSWIDQEVYV